MTRSLRTNAKAAIVFATSLAIMALATGCGSGNEAGKKDSSTPKEVTLRLPLLAIGYTAPFFFAKESGAYKDAGLSVQIGEGKGSPVTAQTVAKGADQFGFVDGATAAILIAKGAPLKVIAGIQPKGSPAVVYRPPIKVKRAQDLIGLTILGTGGNNDILFESVLKKAGMSKSDVKPITVVQAAGAKQAFLNSKNAVYLSNVNADAAALKVIDPSVQTTLYSDLGVNLFGYSLVASDKIIKEQPDVVQAFVTASMKAWKQASADPDAAVKALLKDYPNQDQKQARQQLLATIDLLRTPATNGKPLGWVAESDWSDTLEQLRSTGKVTSDLAPTNYYTNRFVEKANVLP